MGGHGEHDRASLRFHSFKADTFLEDVVARDSRDYLRCYLADLGAEAILEEPYYFDRDYLAEFSTFYSISSRGYSNACRRIHVFSCPVSELRSLFYCALSGNDQGRTALQDRYLGFSVLRPIAATPFGRTVLRWYPETNREIPRVTEPARRYTVHVSGVPLDVEGLAWQQQDSGVGACATVALWTMFHASASDDQHAIPTTVDITRRANARWPLGRRVFPAGDGLSIHQICEAIRGQQLQPAVLEGDRALDVPDLRRAFSRARFASSIAAFIRSGYPTLIAARTRNPNGELGGGHAVCAVGFRPSRSPEVPRGRVLEEDGGIPYIYIHDDNLGPSVRFALTESSLGSGGSQSIVQLETAPPPPLRCSTALRDPTRDYWHLIPTALVAALPAEIRMTSDFLNVRALNLAGVTAQYLQALSHQTGIDLPGVTYASGFFKLSAYMAWELPQRLSGRRLAKARAALTNHVRPMSLHLGVARVGIGGTPLVDVLYDTTDSEPATAAFAHVLFQRFGAAWLGYPGVPVRAF